MKLSHDNKLKLEYYTFCIVCFVIPITLPIVFIMILIEANKSK